MKISELEDAHVLVTKTDLTQAMIEVREGLVDGDEVVARAGALLREGDPVRPMQEKVSQSGK